VNDTTAKKRGGEPDCEIVAERLRVLSDVLDLARAIVPTNQGGGKYPASRPIARAHDQMVTEFIVWASHWFGPLEFDFPINRYRPPGCIDLVATWKSKDAGDTAGAHQQREGVS